MKEAAEPTMEDQVQHQDQDPDSALEVHEVYLPVVQAAVAHLAVPQDIALEVA